MSTQERGVARKRSGRRAALQPPAILCAGRAGCARGSSDARVVLARSRPASGDRLRQRVVADATRQSRMVARDYRSDGRRFALWPTARRLLGGAPVKPVSGCSSRRVEPDGGGGGEQRGKREPRVTHLLVAGALPLCIYRREKARCRLSGLHVSEARFKVPGGTAK